jgi:hypothetical protein
LRLRLGAQAAFYAKNTRKEAILANAAYNGGDTALDTGRTANERTA